MPKTARGCASGLRGRGPTNNDDRSFKRVGRREPSLEPKTPAPMPGALLTDIASPASARRGNVAAAVALHPALDRFAGSWSAAVASLVRGEDERHEKATTPSRPAPQGTCAGTRLWTALLCCDRRVELPEAAGRSVHRRMRTSTMSTCSTKRCSCRGSGAKFAPECWPTPDYARGVKATGRIIRSGGVLRTPRTTEAKEADPMDNAPYAWSRWWTPPPTQTARATSPRARACTSSTCGASRAGFE